MNMRGKGLVRAAFAPLALALQMSIMPCEAVAATKLARLEPAKTGYFGLNIDWGIDSPKSASTSFGFHPKVYVRFFAFPLNDYDMSLLSDTVKQVKARQGMLLLTLEPWGGLDTVTADEAVRFAKQLRKYTSRVKTFVRFAHEMNGSWYPWCQQPTAYKEAFITLAAAVHKQCGSNAAMIWAPNNGGGYPFTGGQYQAMPDSPDYPVLDTNHDGVVNMYDDPYEPYYPGDVAVDWVGMTIYHWGSHYPWGANVIPEEGKFAAQLTGTYNGSIGDETMVPDFYLNYAVAHRKPMAIPETSALFVPATGTPELERQIKETWWNQVFSKESRSQFPAIKMINWFEWEKPESEIGGQVVDWRVSHDKEMLSAFVATLRKAGLGVR